MVKQTSTVLAGVLMSALVVIPLALWFVVGGDPDATAMPSPLLLAAPFVAGVVAHVLLEAVGYRTEPIAPGTPYDEATAQSVVRWQSQMVQRFAYSEIIAVATIALCFVLQEGGYLVLLAGCVTSLVLMSVHVYPWSRPVSRFAASLERDGGRSGLREAFGLESRPGGAIQEL